MALRLQPGTVTLVGGGPGDPGLITVSGLQAVQQADVVLYDRLAPREVLSEAPDGAILQEVGKVPRGEYVPQERINQLLIEHARAGRRVVRLKGGDSFVFGRGGEEWQACAAAGVPVQVVPGVTSSTAGPALAGVPLTHRHLVQGFTVVSGHVGPDSADSCVNWQALAQSGTTLVVLMGVAHLREIAAELMAAGLAEGTPVVVVRDASLPSQQNWAASLGSVADLLDREHITPPAITIIGECAGLDLDRTDEAHRVPSDH